MEGRCVECPSHAILDAVAPWIVVIALGLLIRTAWRRGVKEWWVHWSAHILPGVEKVKPVVLFKILLGFWQAREKP
jgi:hypothetical protein